MIAYFDTSALVPLIIGETTSVEVRQRWDASDRVASARIVYAEGHAALAQAARSRRIGYEALPAAIAKLGEIYERLEILEISDALVRRAGALAEQYALRGYDSIHLAAAELVRGDDAFVFVAGDGDLCGAAERIGMAVVRTGGEAER